MVLLDPKITDISGLQQSLGRWELFEYVAAFVVFLGVLGELLAEFTNLFKTQQNDARKKRFTIVFTLVLLLGLSCELIALIKTSTLTAQITQALRTDITEAYKTAARATVEAGNANERAAAVNQIAAQADERAALANERAAALAKQNTELGLKLAAVEKKQAPRWISTERFVAAFGKARPGKAVIRYQAGNEEIAMFASGSVAPALVASGWHLEEGPRPIPSAHPQGIVAAMSEVFLYTNMKSDSGDPLSPIAGLRRAFSECGFPPAIFANNSLPEDTVLIVVGPKI
jgi:hypothetical protein